jgi:hypothetical protein
MVANQDIVPIGQVTGGPVNRLLMREKRRVQQGTQPLQAVHAQTAPRKRLQIEVEAFGNLPISDTELTRLFGVVAVIQAAHQKRHGVAAQHQPARQGQHGADVPVGAPGLHTDAEGHVTSRGRKCASDEAAFWRVVSSQ